jgi:cathepsin L
MVYKLIFVALLVILVFGKIPIEKQEQLLNYTFEQFIHDFELNFSETEFSFREAIFYKELSRVKAHNAKNLSWKEAINKFSAMTHKEVAQFYGRSKAKAGLTRKSYSNKKFLPKNINMKPVTELPKSVDWRRKGVVSAVKDQGKCGSCWAFASTAVIESHVAINTGLLYDLSTQQLASCSPNPQECGGTGGCDGATAEIAFDYLTKTDGIFQEFQYPYTSYYGVNKECAIPEGTKPVAFINGFQQLPANDYAALMNAVATVGPISISVDASTFRAYSSGIFSGCNQIKPDINHAVVLVGYGEEDDGIKYWIVRNSWSPSFGEGGYLRILRTDNDDEVCGIDVTPEHGSACKGDSNPIKVCGTCGILADSSFPLNAGKNK